MMTLISSRIWSRLTGFQGGGCCQFDIQTIDGIIINNVRIAINRIKKGDIMIIDFVEDVVPLSDLRRRATQIIARIRRTKQPVLVTQRGRSAIVLLDVAEYQRWQTKMALLEHIALGKRDVAAGRVYSQEQIEAYMEEWVEQDE